jgi:hypothetical protein
MRNMRNTVGVLFALLTGLSMAACSGKIQNTGTGTITSSTDWVAPHTELALPTGTNLEFESVAADKLPFSYNHGLCVIQNKPDFENLNSNYSDYYTLHNLYPDTQAKISAIDYTRNFAVIAYTGNQAYNQNTFQIKQVIQSGNNVNLIAEVDSENTEQSLLTSNYQVITVSKLTLSQADAISFVLYDQNGSVMGAQYIPGTSPIRTPTITPDTSHCMEEPPVDVDCLLEMPQLPKEGDPAELNLTLHDVSGLAGAQAWLEFYWTNTQGSYMDTANKVQINPQDVVISGKSNWQIDSPEKEDITLTDTIHFPKVGIWGIRGYLCTSDNQIYSYFLEIAVKTNASMETYKTIDSQDFADMDNLLHGNNRPNTNNYLSSDDQNEPVLIELNVSKPPKAGEKVTVTCKMVALHQDIPNFIANIVLWHYALEHPDALTYSLDYINTDEADFYNSGTLLWQGSLQHNKLVEFSAVISIPESGNWQIYVGGNSLPVNQSFSDIKYSQRYKEINLTVNSDSGSYGFPSFQMATTIDGPPTQGYTQWVGTPSYSAGASSINVPLKKP